MKRTMSVFLLFGFVSALVFAQSSSIVTGWLNRANISCTSALRLARRGDFESDISTITDNLKVAQDYMFRVQNWIEQGNSLSSAQEETLAEIIANANEVNRRMLAWSQQQL